MDGPPRLNRTWKQTKLEAGDRILARYLTAALQDMTRTRQPTVLDTAGVYLLAAIQKFMFQILCFELIFDPLFIV